MSLPEAASAPTPHHTVHAPMTLQEALVKLRHACHEELEVGNGWDLGDGLGVILLAKPASSHEPARLAATATTSATALPAWLTDPKSAKPTTPTKPQPPAATQEEALTGNTIRQHATPVALCDFFARRLHAAIVSSPAARASGIYSDYSDDTVGQFVLETNRAMVCPTTGTVSVVFGLLPASRSGERQLPVGGTAGSAGREDGECMGMGVGMAESLREVVQQGLLSRIYPGGGLDAEGACEHVKSVEDQRHLRALVAASDGIAFVANGSVLPRRGGSDDRPMEEARGAVPFKSPESLRREFRLPNRGVVEGMLVPRGVTVIVGGGYHGKSTLLRALAVGVYDKVPGDGRELAVTDPAAVTVRAEDGRPVSGVDISPFISSLPSSAAGTAPAHTLGQSVGTMANSANGDVGAGAGHSDQDGGGGGSNGVGGITTSRFSTTAASGSTSQAANVMEALEAGASALLLDEDTCAGNFMIRDSRMRAMVHHEPITPFIYRVSSLWLELGVSSVIVVGGCGDYFDVHNTAILVDNYAVFDATERAHSISRRFCVGRVQYAGRGLVHRLPWPDTSSPRALVAESVLGPSRRAAALSTSKRKRDCDADEAGGGAPRDIEAPSDVTPPDGGRGGRASAASFARGDGGDGIGEGGQCETAQRQEKEGARPPQTNKHDATLSAIERCRCPCFCGRRRGAHGPTTATGGAIGEAGSMPANLSRVEQLVGGAAMVVGCALGVRFVAEATEQSPGLSVSDALGLLEAVLTPRGEWRQRGRAVGVGGGCALELLLSRVMRGCEEEHEEHAATAAAFCGGPLVALPRRYEVAAALHRLPGVRFEPAAAADGTRQATVSGESLEETRTA